MIPARSPRQRRRPRARQLFLRARGKRGGYRGNAGRPTGRSDHYVPHVPRPKLTEREAVHVTMKLVPGLPNLRRPIPTGIVAWVFRAERERKGFRLVHYAVRRNHIHLVCEGNHALALSRGIQRLASRIARALNKRWGRRGRVFVDRFHEHVVSSPREMRNVLGYVLLNQHKDMAALGHTQLGLDPYSSGAWFDGWADFPECLSLERGPPPVTAPRSWVCRRGWRRHGLLTTEQMAPRA